MSLGFIKVYYNWSEVTATLSDAEKGRLITALVDYASVGSLPELSGAERHLFPLLRSLVDQDKCEQEAKAKISRENGAKGGRPRKNPENPTGFNGNPENPAGFSNNPENPTGYLGYSGFSQREKEKYQKKKRNTTFTTYSAREESAEPVEVLPFVAYCRQNGIPLLPKNFEEIRDFYECGITDDMLDYALEQSVERNSKSFSYIRSIVNRWIVSGAKTLDEIKARDEQFRQDKARALSHEDQDNARSKPTRSPPDSPAPVFFSDIDISEGSNS